MTTWVYLTNIGQPKFTVGFYKPDGKWEAESDHDDKDKAAARVHYLNGGDEAAKTEIIFAYDLMVLLRVFCGGNGGLYALTPKSEPETRALAWLVEHGYLKQHAAHVYEPTRAGRSYIQKIAHMA